METILYIPGLGDAKPTEWIVKRWEKPGRSIITFSTQWAKSETCKQKYSRLVKVYKSIKDKDNITVIAQSAGGSLATRLVSEFPDIKSAKLISCKIKGSATIGETFQKRAPALLDSVIASEQALESIKKFEHKITVYRPWYEWTVPLKDMTAGNVAKRRVPAIGHPFGIGVTMLFYIS